MSTRIADLRLKPRWSTPIGLPLYANLGVSRNFLQKIHSDDEEIFLLWAEFNFKLRRCWIGKTALSALPKPADRPKRDHMEQREQNRAAAAGSASLGSS